MDSDKEKHIKMYKEKDRDIVETSYTVAKERLKNNLNRIEEIILFSKKMGYKKIGIAHCFALTEPAEKLKIMLEKDFEVVIAKCKIEDIAKTDIGVEENFPGSGEIACNPLAQADFLNNANVDLIVLVGPCLGHDIIFFKHAKAPVTQLIVKDKATGHRTIDILK